MPLLPMNKAKPGENPFWCMVPEDMLIDPILRQRISYRPSPGGEDESSSASCISLETMFDDWTEHLEGRRIG